MFCRILEWSPVDDFGQTEAKDGPFTFVAWENSHNGELRLIRRDNVGGIIVPLSDFSIYCRDRRSAQRIAERINKELRKARRYNGFQTL